MQGICSRREPGVSTPQNKDPTELALRLGSGGTVTQDERHQAGDPFLHSRGCPGSGSPRTGPLPWDGDPSQLRTGEIARTPLRKSFPAPTPKIFLPHLQFISPKRAHWIYVRPITQDCRRHGYASNEPSNTEVCLRSKV